MKPRRIVVALDASTASLAALEAAAVLAAHRGAELVGVFVEDQNLFRCAGYPFAYEIDAVSGEVRRFCPESLRETLTALAMEAKRALEEEARRTGLRSQFLTVQGFVREELLARAREAELLVIGRVGGGQGGRTLGSTAQALLLGASGQVLVLREGAALKAPVGVLCWPGDDWKTLAEIAREIAHACGDGILLLLLLSQNHLPGEPWKEKAQALAWELGVRATVRTVIGPSAVAIAGELWKEGVGVIVTSRTYAAKEKDLFLELLSDLECAWLVV
jgi:nucleotide-binding universal stress UspA family protein